MFSADTAAAAVRGAAAVDTPLSNTETAEGTEGEGGGGGGGEKREGGSSRCNTDVGTLLEGLDDANRARHYSTLYSTWHQCPPTSGSSTLQSQSTQQAGRSHANNPYRRR